MLQPLSQMVSLLQGTGSSGDGGTTWSRRLWNKCSSLSSGMTISKRATIPKIDINFHQLYARMNPPFRRESIHKTWVTDVLQGGSHKFSLHPDQASSVWRWPLIHSKFPKYIEFLTFSGYTGLVTVPQNSFFSWNFEWDLVYKG